MKDNRPRSLTWPEIQAFQRAVDAARYRDDFVCMLGQPQSWPRSIRYAIASAGAVPVRPPLRVIRQRGFSLLELSIALAVSAILAVCAMPSIAHHNQQAQLQAAVTSFVWTYEQVPVLPRDPTWSLSGNTWTKTYTMPAGTLRITTPTTTGGSFKCSFAPGVWSLRC